ncbi:MAG: hypothetical protein RBT41_12275 [Clostridia bacterium]|jgi:hypothetical protein|nr:hypothetical protein [Clostridia bacterium]
MALSGILVLIPLVVIVVIALTVFAARVDSQKEGGEEVIKNVYIYLVLFATLMMTIGGSVAIFMAAADIISPAPYYQTFDEYKRYGGKEIPAPDGGTQTQELSEEQMLANYNAMVDAERARQVERAQNTLVKSLGWIVIPLPVFLYFQKKLSIKTGQ